jgi:uncharacterized protein GlcG (DUF336 family)
VSVYLPYISLNIAQAAVAAATQKAARMGVRATIVVLDQGGEQVAMARMDGTWPGAFDLATGKAQTARSFHAPSSTFVAMIQPGADLFSVSNTGGGKYVILPGGVPVSHEGHVAGAIGVSGGTGEQDAAIADAALEAARRKFKEADQRSPGNRRAV